MFFYTLISSTIMKIIIYGDDENTKLLNTKVQNCLEELWLWDFIKLESSNDESLKADLGIEKQPALIVEEEAIDFKDTIFEWIVPDEEEIKAMFISIIWGGEGWSCGSKESDGSCGTGCAC